MGDINNLKGQRVLVTRPEPENQSFCQWVREQGGEPIAFPLIEITPSLIAMPEITAPIAGVIFISKAAIDYGFWPAFNALKSVFSRSVHQKNLLACYTVGYASAVHLKNCYEKEKNDYAQSNQQRDQSALNDKIIEQTNREFMISIEYPSEGHGGEALLRLPRFKNLKNECWWIVRGGAGLEWLYQQMSMRGAAVHYWDAYLRKPIGYPHEQIQAVLQKEIEVILLFSGEVVEIFQVMFSCLSIEYQNRVKSAKVWVLSDRVADLAQKAGFTDIQILTEPFFKKEAF